MNTTELYNHFRGVIDDTEKPFLWSDEEVFIYMDAAQIKFTQRSGGIADTRSPATVVPVIAVEILDDLEHTTMYIESDLLVSTGRDVAVLNATQPLPNTTNDYGKWLSPLTQDTTGPIRAIVIGEEEDIGRWVYVPVEDDEVNLTIRRLPCDVISDKDQEFEIPRRHHEYLVMWMMHRAFSKTDAETFDRGKSNESRDDFLRYCESARREWDRKKHAPRQMEYGGL